MKHDNILKWLNDSRVTIVHQRDLETKSVARVAIFNYSELLKKDIEIPVSLPNEFLLRFLIEKGYVNKAIISMDCILEIERRWVVETLDKWELMDALAYCYSFLLQIVIDAHKQVGININNCDVRDMLHSYEVHSNGIPCCMYNNAQYRLTRLSLKNLQQKDTNFQKVKINPKITEKAISRYNLDKESISIKTDNVDIIKFAEKLVKMSKQVLAKDKHHLPIVYLYSPQKGFQLLCLRPEDKSDKYILAKEIADIVAKSDIDAVISIFESWLTQDIETFSKNLSAEKCSDRKECLDVTVVTSQGNITTYTTIFTRGVMGNIKFQETIIDSKTKAGFMQPILEVWEKRRFNQE